MNKEYDVAVIGAGPAGYVAAIRCAQLGLKTACIDKWIDKDNTPRLGGTCLNVGCIPSKALLESSEAFQKSAEEMDQHGINIKGVSLDLEKMMSRKSEVVNKLTFGIESLFNANKIDWLPGNAKIAPGREINIELHDGTSLVVNAKNIIIATGSTPVDIPVAPQDNDKIVNSTGALEFTSVPKKLGIIGAGVIGLELGSVWRRLGSEVIIFEAQEEFMSFADRQIAKESLKDFAHQGLDIRLGTRLLAAHSKDSNVEITYQDDQGDHNDSFDKLIIAVGRRPNSEELFEDEPEIVIDEGGFFHVNDKCETSLPRVYAIGDVVRGPMLAHKGSEEGIMVAELIAGNFSEVNYQLIPYVIYTSPEIAWVGKTEQELKAVGANYNVGSFPFAASGRAQAVNETTGLVKMISDATTDRILGVHIFGAHASEMIAQAVIAMEFNASAEDVALTMFAHPTFSEAFHEAALAVSGNAIHIKQKR